MARDDWLSGCCTIQSIRHRFVFGFRVKSLMVNVLRNDHVSGVEAVGFRFSRDYNYGEPYLKNSARVINSFDIGSNY
jgi:hypothetical protein